MRSDQLADPAVLEEYRQLAEEEWPVMIPMYQLVACLCQKEYASLLPVATSHNALVIAGEDWDGFTVEYKPRHQTFEVRYRHPKTNRMERHVGDSVAAERFIDSLSLRLILRRRYHEAAYHCSASSSWPNVSPDTLSEEPRPFRVQ